MDTYSWAFFKKKFLFSSYISNATKHIEAEAPINSPWSFFQLLLKELKVFFCLDLELKPDYLDPIF